MFILPRGISIEEGIFKINELPQPFKNKTQPSRSIQSNEELKWLQDILQIGEMSAEKALDSHCLFLLDLTNIVNPTKHNQVRVTNDEEKQKRKNLDEFLCALKKMKCPFFENFPRKEFLFGDIKGIKYCMDCINWVRDYFNNNGILREKSQSVRKFYILRSKQTSNGNENKNEKKTRKNSNKKDEVIVDKVNQLLNEKEIPEMKFNQNKYTLKIRNLFWLDKKERNEILKTKRREVGYGYSQSKEPNFSNDGNFQNDQNSDLDFFSSDGNNGNWSKLETKQDQEEEQEQEQEQEQEENQKYKKKLVNDYGYEVEHQPNYDYSDSFIESTISSNVVFSEMETDGESDNINSLENSENDSENNQNNKNTVNSKKSKNNQESKFNEFIKAPRFNTTNQYLSNDLETLISIINSKQETTIPNCKHYIYLFFFLFNTIDEWKSNNHRKSLAYKNSKLIENYDELIENVYLDVLDITKMGNFEFQCKIIREKGLTKKKKTRKKNFSKIDFSFDQGYTEEDNSKTKKTKKPKRKNISKIIFSEEEEEDKDKGGVGENNKKDQNKIKKKKQEKEDDHEETVASISLNGKRITITTKIGNKTEIIFSSPLNDVALSIKPNDLTLLSFKTNKQKKTKKTKNQKIQDQLNTENWQNMDQYICKFNDKHHCAQCLFTTIYFQYAKNLKKTIGYNPSSKIVPERFDFQKRIFPSNVKAKKSFYKLYSDIGKIDLSTKPTKIIQGFYNKGGVNFFINVFLQRSYPLQAAYLKITKKNLIICSKSSTLYKLSFNDEITIQKHPTFNYFKLSGNRKNTCRATKEKSVIIVCKKKFERSLIIRTILHFMSQDKN
ncbi:transcription initiation factor tfiid subunit [Anaeramoeba flamelloides]|uniref:Transcription initiation factor tfiid subunit n=1 Tax=Anaeramoeba flamelloides TaxID=1746091 RepID=A0AAV7Y6G0_9EUKA|nr:transcription initiation factor tfiid subunit [Anaeramoeba flamelloides]